jgi:hypothetical protein
MAAVQFARKVPPRRTSSLRRASNDRSGIHTVERRFQILDDGDLKAAMEPLVERRGSSFKITMIGLVILYALSLPLSYA